MSKLFRIPALLLALFAAPLAVGCDVDDDDEKTIRDDKPGPDEIADPDDDDDEDSDEDDCKVSGNLPPNQPDPDGTIKACPD
jgi:hypothetical protein